MNYCKKFKEIRLNDTPMVGGKTASLGEMISQLSPNGIRVPDGFAITADAYWHYLDSNNLRAPIKEQLGKLTTQYDPQTLKQVAQQVRTMIEQATMPDDLAQEVLKSYHDLSKGYGKTDLDVAVRSSATAEDLPGASFAGQQDTYLNIHGNQALLAYCKKCLASLFTDRAIAYRIDKGFDHLKVALTIAVQKMVRSDLACAGVSFSLDTESGFKDVVMINASWGLGEMIVQGSVIPDEYVVYKPLLAQGFVPIIKKQLGQKREKMVYTDNNQSPVRVVEVSAAQQQHYCLNDKEIVELATAVMAIEKHYSQLKRDWCPMDVEWAKDGTDGLLYIVQARPETIFSGKNHANKITVYRLLQDHHKATLLGTGQSIGQKIAHGKSRLLTSAADLAQVKEGDIIVTQMTDPAWVPAMKKAAGIITDRGGRTCHAAIVSRELGIPAIVGFSQATNVIKDNADITIDCSRGSTGYVYSGIVDFETETIELGDVPKLPAKIMVNVADPASAFQVSQLPVDGVGLARTEFIISNTIRVHPMALIHPEKVTDAKIKHEIDDLVAPYSSKTDFFVESLSQGIGLIAAAFYPKPVIVRFSDFKSNEYRNLLGGSYFELQEENPMIGLRGASRYYNERYQEAFVLECAALKRVRETMGLTNVVSMIPFVRTITEAEKVLAIMADNGLKASNDFKIYLMIEVPSSVILIDEYAKLFDGFSIGSNDLTQLTLGVDRDSQILAPLFDERDPAIKKMMKMAIEGAKKSGKHIGICGQAPSDYRDVAEFLIKLGIDSLSLNSDAVIPFFMGYAKK